jgi:DNA-binding PadR family transcriptional regulator
MRNFEDFGRSSFGGQMGRRGERGPHRGEHGGGGGRHGGPGARRARRGNVRAAVLALLSEQPMHGYQMIQELSRRSGGAWTPSPGSIYPTLQMLEDEGLVTSHQSDDGKRLFELTDAGRAEAAKSHEGPGHRPWEQSGHGRGSIPVDLVAAIRDTAVSLIYAATTGNDEQRAQVVSLLGEFREKVSAVVPGGPQPGDTRGPFGPGGRSRSSRGSGPGWNFGVPNWLFGGPTGGPFGPGGFWGSGSEESAGRGFTWSSSAGGPSDGDADNDEDDVEL